MFKGGFNKMKEFKIKFRSKDIDTEELREVIEDNLGVEILEIEEVYN